VAARSATARRATKAGKAASFRILRKGDCCEYRDKRIAFAARDRPANSGSWIPIEIPYEIEQSDGTETYVLRPWRMWVAEDEYWRPSYDAALARHRPQICKRLASWLEARGHRVRIVEKLPDAKSPLRLKRVSLVSMKTLLEFLLNTDLRLSGAKRPNPIYPGAADPMEVFRGAGAPRKWYVTQGGENNVDVVGRIPAARVRRAFVLPEGDQGSISISERRIEAGGGDLWEAIIWAQTS